MTDRSLDRALEPLFIIDSYSSSNISSDLYYGDTLNGILTFKSSLDLEVPVYNADSSLRHILSNDLGSKMHVLLKPYGNTIKIYRTPGMLFKNLLMTPCISTCTSSKNELYHGGKGIIMDANKHPLLLCTIRGIFDAITNSIEFNEFVIYINPKVFYSNNTLEKFIVSKVIPHITAKRLIPVIIYSYLRNVKFNFKISDFQNKVEPKIVISSDIDKFFIDNHRDLNADILLQNNVDDLINFMFSV